MTNLNLSLNNSESQITKICTKCGEEKQATPEYFHAYKRSSDGRRSVCRVCRSEQSRIYRKNNLEVLLEKERERREVNAEKIHESSLKWRAANIEKERERGRKRRADNPQQLRRNHQKWEAENIEKERKRGRLNSKRRHKSLYGRDSFFTINTRVRSVLWYSIRKIKKDRHVYDALGWSVSDLIRHLRKLFTPGMTMDALMRGEIHIDHIRPICSFNYNSMDDPEFKQCWSLSNLQPLWAHDNHSKGGKWNG
ncbi:MAG: hypothetical protein ABFD75_12195 [Smithella sp.]